ncbi:uncharacterized protein BDR25DRAFT_22689 [Lindgomyces ingoldianus]|uniref:Uncharacterized protein n=1 Tax=Lindgomyces ingoldianus TaxID=673940 RepID=A0ACB6QXW4_9PLEO|nr:uncharacterized protein BDR25DRAFT_22689 [Lindgomyces ingoldianus]KAF2471751.1 hypothetical protein BDR25DRAFT_22689 [Lindgomyces ingoldianus]
MPQKRPHTKSRLGCDRCRKRRVKCDEKEPRCTNCTARHEQCQYLRRFHSPLKSSAAYPHLDASPALSSSSSQDMPLASSIGGHATGTPSPRSQTRVRELELMHHWSTKTCEGFWQSNVEIFRVHVTQEAFRHSYLMDAIFALTSLHLACETGDAKASCAHVGTALEYQNQTLSGLRKTLDSNITPSNCDAVFVTSVLMLVCAIVSPLLPTNFQDHRRPTTEAMLKVVDFINAITSIVDLSRPWLLNGPISGMFGTVRDKSLSAESLLPAQRLRTLNDTYVGVEDRRYATFETAIQTLETFSSWDRPIMVWPAKVGPKFLAELRRGDVVAKAFFMYWGVLIAHLDDMWWSRFSGKALVEDLSSALALTERSNALDELTRFCRRQVGLSE